MAPTTPATRSEATVLGEQEREGGVPPGPREGAGGGPAGPGPAFRSWDERRSDKSRPMGDAVLSTELQAAARGALALAAWGHGGQRPPSRGPGPRHPSGQPGNGRREEREEPPPGTQPCRPLRGAAGRKQPLVDAGTPRPTRPRCPGLRRGPWPRASRSQRRPKPPTSSACLSLQSKCFSLLRGTVMLQGTGTRSAGATAARPTRQPRPSDKLTEGRAGGPGPHPTAGHQEAAAPGSGGRPRPAVGWERAWHTAWPPPPGRGPAGQHQQLPTAGPRPRPTRPAGAEATLTLSPGGSCGPR